MLGRAVDPASLPTYTADNVAVPLFDKDTGRILTSTVLAASTGTQEVVGDVADDAVAAGNPVRIGAVSKDFDGTDPGAVSAENDLAGLVCDANRRLYVNPVHPRLWTATADYSSAQTNTEIQAAPGASLSLYITDVVVSNGAVAGTVKFVESTAASPATKISPLYLAINGGAALHFKTPIKLTANKNFGITSVTSTTHSVTINGFTAP